VVWRCRTGGFLLACEPGILGFAGRRLVTVGLAVFPGTFAQIREANGNPRLADVPPDQDAKEFELHFPTEISLDILTTADPTAEGAIARYLKRFGEGMPASGIGARM